MNKNITDIEKYESKMRLFLDNFKKTIVKKDIELKKNINNMKLHKLLKDKISN